VDRGRGDEGALGRLGEEGDVLALEVVLDEGAGGLAGDAELLGGVVRVREEEERLRAVVGVEAEKGGVRFG